jgi:hypothetical protein
MCFLVRLERVREGDQSVMGGGINTQTYHRGLRPGRKRYGARPPLICCSPFGTAQTSSRPRACKRETTRRVHHSQHSRSMHIASQHGSCIIPTKQNRSAYRKRMTFRPPENTNTKRKNSESNVLAGYPASVDPRDIHMRAAELWDGSQYRFAQSSFGQTRELVGTV